MLEFFVKLPRCLIGIEGVMQRALLGTQADDHGVDRQPDGAAIRQLYVTTSRKDVADAEAICEAVMRPNMCFVPIKSDEPVTVISISSLGSAEAPSWVVTFRTHVVFSR
jgi:transposase